MVVVNHFVSKAVSDLFTCGLTTCDDWLDKVESVIRTEAVLLS